MPAIADNDARDRKGAIPSGINRWLEWADWNEPRFCIRTEKAKPIAEKRAVWLRSYLQAVADDLAETF
jgi:hypothetical protein